jgi:hypothetical protein
VIGSGLVAALEIALIGGANLGDYWHPPIADYAHTALTNPDNAGFALWALVTGHFALAADAQPVMGAVSLAFRAPFAALGHALGGLGTEYRFGAFACLWVLALVAFAIPARASGLRWTTRVLAAAVILLSGAVVDAIRSGHPEELLAAALACAGVWAAASGRPLVAGATLGLAIGTLQWTAVALVPALLATTNARLRLVGSALVVGAVFALALPIANPHAYRGQARTLSHWKRVYDTSAWRPFATQRRIVFSTGGRDNEQRTVYFMPGRLDRGAALILAGALAVGLGALVHVRRRNALLGLDALALLSAVLFLRSFLDPANIEYYAVPAFTALAAWEVLAARRPPVIALAITILDAITFKGAIGRAALSEVVYLTWSCALLAYLLVICLRTGSTRETPRGPRLLRRDPRASLRPRALATNSSQEPRSP